MSVYFDGRRATFPPSGRVMWPEWIPPRCPGDCVPGCETLYGVTVYRILSLQRADRTNPFTLRAEARVFISAAADEFYFDKYGCRRRGPPPRRADPLRVVLYREPVAGTAWTNPAVAWPRVIEQLQALGAPAPGTIRLLPSVRWALTRLAAFSWD